MFSGGIGSGRGKGVYSSSSILLRSVRNSVLIRRVSPASFSFPPSPLPHKHTHTGISWIHWMRILFPKDSPPLLGILVLCLVCYSSDRLRQSRTDLTHQHETLSNCSISKPKLVLFYRSFPVVVDRFRPAVSHPTYQSNRWADQWKYRTVLYLPRYISKPEDVRYGGKGAEDGSNSWRRTRTR